MHRRAKAASGRNLEYAKSIYLDGSNSASVIVGPESAQNLVVKFDGGICGGILVEHASDNFSSKEARKSSCKLRRKFATNFIETFANFTLEVAGAYNRVLVETDFEASKTPPPPGFWLRNYHTRGNKYILSSRRFVWCICIRIKFKFINQEIFHVYVFGPVTI